GEVVRRRDPAGADDRDRRRHWPDGRRLGRLAVARSRACRGRGGAISGRLRAAAARLFGGEGGGRTRLPAGAAGRGGGGARAAGACGEGGRRKGGALRRRAARGGGRARGRRAEAPGGSGGRMTGTVTTVGTFDGVHRGHQAVLAEIVQRARGQGLASLVVTFDPHPLEVVNPAAAPRLLTLPDEKRELVAALGLDRVELVPFTAALARLSPEQFVREVLRARYGMRELVLGYDHGFGRGRTGDVDLVRRLAREGGFVVDVVDAVRDDGQPISSSLIRTA